MGQLHGNFIKSLTCQWSNYWNFFHEKSGGSYSDLLRKVNVPIVSDEECGINYGADDIKLSMICAGYPQGKITHQICKWVARWVLNLVNKCIGYKAIEQRVNQCWNVTNRWSWFVPGGLRRSTLREEHGPSGGNRIVGLRMRFARISRCLHRSFLLHRMGPICCRRPVTCFRPMPRCFSPIH